MVNIRVYKVKLEYIQCVDMRNRVWKWACTVFRQKMRSACDAFERNDLDRSSGPRPLRFDYPHPSVGVAVVLRRYEPAHQGTWNYFMVVSISEREQEMEACNEHPLHPGFIFVLNNEDRVVAGVAVPRWIASDALSIHPAGTTKITRRIKACDH